MSSSDSGMSSVMLATASYERLSTSSSSYISDEGISCRQRETEAKRVDSIEEEEDDVEISNIDAVNPHISKPSTLEEEINLVAHEDENGKEVVAVEATLNETSDVFSSNENGVVENVEYSSRDDSDGKEFCRYSEVEANYGMRTRRRQSSRSKSRNWCQIFVIVTTMQIILIGGAVVVVLWKIESMQEMINELNEESVTSAPQVGSPNIHKHEIIEKYYGKFPMEDKSNATNFVPFLHCDVNVNSQTITSNNLICNGKDFSVEHTAKYHISLQLFVYGGVEALKVKYNKNIYVEILYDSAHAGSFRHSDVISKSTLRTSDGIHSKVLTTYLSATLYLERGDKISVRLSAALPEKVRLQKSYSSMTAFEL